MLDQVAANWPGRGDRDRLPGLGHERVVYGLNTPLLQDVQFHFRMGGLPEISEFFEIDDRGLDSTFEHFNSIVLVGGVETI